MKILKSIQIKQQRPLVERHGVWCTRRFLFRNSLYKLSCWASRRLWCTKQYCCNLIWLSKTTRVFQFQTQFYTQLKTTAHELGHIFGSHHDGSGNNCSSSDNYIMSPYTTSDEPLSFLTFSSCSISQFKASLLNTNLKYLTNFLCL